MNPQEIQELVEAVSQNVIDIGKHIGSAKPEPENLKKLADALRYAAQTTDVVRDALLENQ